MLKLVYSNRTEELLNAFVRDVAQLRAATGPLDPVVVVVPNRNVETFLRFGLARRTGIAANLDVRYLRRFLRSLAGRRADLRVVDGEALEAMLLSLLLDEEVLAAPALAPVRAWLDAAGSARQVVDVRRHQLAVQLAHVFEEYGYSRPEMLTAWQRQLVLQDTGGAEVERWQREIWLKLFGPGGLAERRRIATGVEWVPFSNFFEGVQMRDAAPKRVHLFGVSYVARFFHHVLAEVARAGELHAYTLNPCREFWEDVRSGREKDLSGADPDPFGLEQADTPALRLWGRPGRENIRLLNALTECDFQEAFRDAPATGATLLQRFQQDILERAPERTQPEPDAFREDSSITFLRCPSVRSEAETIAAEIWRLVSDDKAAASQDGREPLRFNDIAVLVNQHESEEYFAHLSAAFAEAQGIPYSIIDLPFAGSSRVAEAMALILALPAGRFTRAELLGVLTHPLVAGRFPEASPADWTAWCDGLGIVHGADHGDHASTYIEADVLNWDQGVRRLALGVFLPGKRSGAAQAFALPSSAYLPFEVGASEQESAARFGLLVQSLIADARFAASSELTVAEWVAFFRALAEAYLAPATPAEQGELERWTAALSSLAEMDVDGRKLSYPLARALVSSALDAVGGSRGQHLAEGVVLSTCQPMRALPFRAVFLAGLGEGRFPAAVRRNHLDLRLVQRRPGDVSAREQDKYVFLESIVCTRERLYCSWVARHPLTGEPLEPSSVVVELRHMLERGYVGEEGLKRLDRTVPLRRHEAAAKGELLGQVLPEAAREARSALLRSDYVAQLHRPPPPARILRAQLGEKTWSVLAAQLALVPPPAPTVEVTNTPLRLTLASLRKFLECPLQAWARHRLRLGNEDEEDLIDCEDEPFALERLEESVILSSALREGVARANGDGAKLDLAATYDELARLGALSGHHPLGVFAQTTRETYVETLDAWQDLLVDDVGRGRLPGALEPVRFGRAEEHERAPHLEEPILLAVEYDGPNGRITRRVELSGRTDPLLEGRSGSVIFERRSLRTDWTEGARHHRKGLRAFIDHLALAAAGLTSGQPHLAHLCIADPKGGKRAAAYAIEPFTRDEARAYLGTLVGDLLSRVHDYALPCEAVLDVKLRGPNDYPAAVASSFEERAPLPASSRYGPVPNPERYPVPPDAEEIVTQRFGPFFMHFRPLGEA